MSSSSLVKQGQGQSEEPDDIASLPSAINGHNFNDHDEDDEIKEEEQEHDFLESTCCSSSSVRRSRSRAREEVAQVWQQRRSSASTRSQNQNQYEHSSKQKQPVVTDRGSTRKGSSTSNNNGMPPLCALFQKSFWEHVFSAGKQDQQQTLKANDSTLLAWKKQEKKEEHHPPSASTAHTTARHTRKEPFPSLLPIFQAHALRKQISFLLQQQQQQQTTPNSEVQDHVLSILPAGYDWNQAVLKMATSRSRAFWLVDLAAIIHRLVSWQKLCCSGPSVTSVVLDGSRKKKKQSIGASSRIKFLYHVSANAHAQLLTVLQQFPSVGLVTTTKFDIEQCRKVLRQSSSSTSNNNKNSNHHKVQLYDDASVPGKPDGYLRTAVLPQGTSSSDDQQHDSQHSLLLSCLAVDGPAEVQRIMESLQRIVKRRRQRQTAAGLLATPPSLDFILRLSTSPPTTPGGGTDNNEARILEQWKTLWDATWQCVQQTSSSSSSTSSSMDGSINHCALNLIGVSIDLAHVRGAALVERLQSMESFLLHHYESRQEAQHQPIQRLDLTGLPMEDSEPDDFKLIVDWWNHLLSSSSSTTPSRSSAKDDDNDTTWLPGLVQEITVDITTQLMAPAGALCTRIIGVKQQQDAKSSHENDGATDEAAAATTRAPLRQHYYIDDGCYGSLYQHDDENQPGEEDAASSSSSFSPVPLIMSTRHDEEQRQEGSLNLNDNGNDPTSAVHLSTVWGPTCDGLDRVCRDIYLPRLQRDDWLVFPGRCSGDGLGTAFNGFCPPDTVYCVLGYFQK